MADIKFEIVQHCCVLEHREPAWNTELNIVKWNDNEPKYDIRQWAPDHSKCGKGVTLTLEALQELVKYCEEARIHEI